MILKKLQSASATSKLILSISGSVCAILLCASVFIVSINKATANDTKSFNFPEKLTKTDVAAIQNSNGKYKMELTAINNANTGNTFWYILAYNTQTGKSKFYYGSVNDGTQAAISKFQLPSKPVN